MSLPPTRRKFANDWDEVEYLYWKLLYWFYEQDNPARARGYAARLERLLPKVAGSHEAILGQECRSLLYELKGDLRNAIKHREQETRLIKRLLELAKDSPSKDFILRAYDYSDLSDRLELLAMLHHEAGELDKALAVLREAKQLCARHRLPFDGRDLLEEYLAEARTNHQ
jgi:hypothetical protein